MAAPTVVSKTIAADGYTLSIVWSEAVQKNDNTVALAVAARSLTNTATYTSGSLTTTTVYLLDTDYPIRTGETVTITITANHVESVSTSTANSLITAGSVTNNSATATVACTGTASGMMRNSCAVFRPTYSQSASSAGVKTAWSIPYDAVCCSIQNKSAGEGTPSAARMAEYDYAGYFTTSASFAIGDRIINLTGPGNQSGRQYEVVGSPVDHAGLAAYQFLPLRATRQ